MVLLLITYYIIRKAGLLPSPLSLFKPKPVLIDETPVLIKNIKTIGQLVTYTAYDEVVVDSTIVSRGAAIANSINRMSPFAILPVPDHKLVLIAKGKILAGVDFASMSSNEIKLRNDTIIVFLPKAKILDAISNPSDFETFIEKGSWSNEAVIQLKLATRQRLINRALQRGILQKANKKATDVMESFLKGLSTKPVLVQTIE